MNTEESLRIFCEEDGCKRLFLSERCKSAHIRTFHVTLSNESWIIDDPSVKLVRLGKTTNLADAISSDNSEVYSEQYPEISTGTCLEEINVFSCPVENCKSSFATLENLRSHICHEFATPKKCPNENCEVFVKPCDLKEHLSDCKSGGAKRFFCALPDCKASFATKTSLRNHIKLTHRAPVKCPYEDCNLMLKPGSLKGHQMAIHQKIKKTCGNCGKKVYYLGLKTHLDKCMSNGEKKYFCPVDDCLASFSSKPSLNSHKHEFHGPKVKCPYEDCPSYLKRYYLATHVKKVHDKQKIPCSNCQKLIMHYKFKKHKEICGQEKELCTHCGRDVPSIRLQKHLQLCHMGKLRCEIGGCNSSFIEEKHLKEHVTNVHALPIKCPYENCDTLLKPLNLKDHIKAIHEKVKGICDNCGKEVTLRQLKQHLQRCANDGTKNVCCEVEGCEATFIDQRTMAAHVFKVHQDPVKCPYDDCGVYMKPNSLSRHLKSVHDKTTQECQSCGEQIVWRYLKKHAAKCTGQKNKE